MAPGILPQKKMMEMCAKICGSSILMPTGTANIMLNPEYREKTCQADGGGADDELCSQPTMTELLMVVYNNLQGFNGGQNALKALMDASANIPNQSREITSEFNEEYIKKTEELKYETDETVQKAQMKMKNDLTKSMTGLPAVQTLKAALLFIKGKTDIIKAKVTELTSRLIEQSSKCGSIVSSPKRRQLCSSGLIMARENRAAGIDLYTYTLHCHVHGHVRRHVYEHVYAHVHSHVYVHLYRPLLLICVHACLWTWFETNVLSYLYRVLYRLLLLHFWRCTAPPWKVRVAKEHKKKE